MTPMRVMRPASRKGSGDCSRSARDVGSVTRGQEFRPRQRAGDRSGLSPKLSALMTVPLFDQSTPLTPLRERLHARVAEVLDRGVFILGPELRAFEEEFASYLGARHVIGVGNGTDA